MSNSSSILIRVFVIPYIHNYRQRMIVNLTTPDIEWTEKLGMQGKISYATNTDRLHDCYESALLSPISLGLPKV